MRSFTSANGGLLGDLRQVGRGSRHVGHATSNRFDGIVDLGAELGDQTVDLLLPPLAPASLLDLLFFEPQTLDGGGAEHVDGARKIADLVLAVAARQLSLKFAVTEPTNVGGQRCKGARQTAGELHRDATDQKQHRRGDGNENQRQPVDRRQRILAIMQRQHLPAGTHRRQRRELDSTRLDLCLEHLALRRLAQGICRQVDQHVALCRLAECETRTGFRRYQDGASSRAKPGLVGQNLGGLRHVDAQCHHGDKAAFHDHRCHEVAAEADRSGRVRHESGEGGLESGGLGARRRDHRLDDVDQRRLVLGIGDAAAEQLVLGIGIVGLATIVEQHQIVKAGIAQS